MASPEKIGKEVLKIITDSDYRETMKAELKKVRLKLGEGGASVRAANAVCRLLERNH